MGSFPVLHTVVKRVYNFQFKVNFNKKKSLALLRPENMSSCYTKLLKSKHFVEHKEIWKLFLENYEAQWIGTMKNSRRGDRYNKTIWNQYRYLRENSMKTTSSLESWHNKLEIAVNKTSSYLSISSTVSILNSQLLRSTSLILT